VGQRVAHAGGKRGEGGPGKESRKERENWAGPMGFGLLLSSLLFFFFSIPKPFKQTHLNSNEFEFKLYKLNTNKTNAPA
jgi:hypothetical protein